MRYIKYAVALMSLLYIKGTNSDVTSASESKELSQYKDVNILYSQRFIFAIGTTFHWTGCSLGNLV